MYILLGVLKSVNNCSEWQLIFSKIYKLIKSLFLFNLYILWFQYISLLSSLYRSDLENIEKWFVHCFHNKKYFYICTLYYLYIILLPIYIKLQVLSFPKLRNSSFSNICNWPEMYILKLVFLVNYLLIYFTTLVNVSLFFLKNY